MFKYCATLLTVLCVLDSQIINIVGANLEPVCSRFHYEEQLLEKMIRLETKFERLLEGVKELETDVKSDLGAIRQERSEEKAVFDKIISDIEGNMKTFDTKLAEISEDLERKLGRLSGGLTEIRNKTDRNEVADDDKVKTIAFEAHKVKNTSPNYGHKFVFTDTKLNQGDGYNNATGIFIAPTDGVYLIMAQFCIPTPKYMQFDIVVNEVVHKAAQFSSSPSYHHCHSTQVVLGLKSEDNVWIKCIGGSGSSVLNDARKHVNTFSGVLIG